MSKNQRNIMLVLLIAIGVVAGSNTGLLNNFFTIGFSDYGIFDDFEDGIDNNLWFTKNVIEKDGKAVFETTTADALCLQTGSCNVATINDRLRYLGSLEGQDMRWTIDVQTGRVGFCQNPLVIARVDRNCEIRRNPSDDLVYEIFVSDLDATKAEFHLNGVKQCEFNPQNAELEIEIQTNSGLNQGSCPSTISIEEFRFRKPFRAKVDPAIEAVYQKTFVGPKTISLNSFTVPVKSFVLSNPVTIISSAEQGVDTSAEPLAVWSKGGTVDIPLGEVWQVLYIGDKKFTEGKECIKGFDTDTNACVEQITFVQECSEDQVLDPISKTCTNTIRFACDRSGGVFRDGECTIQGQVVETPINTNLLLLGVLAVLLILLFRLRRR